MCQQATAAKLKLKMGLFVCLSVWLSGCGSLLTLIPLQQAAAPAAPTAQPSSNPSTLSLVDQLRAGGLVIVLRNTSVDRSNSSNNIPTGECVLRFPLSKEGRERAVLIGNTFKRLRIPVGNVFTSVSCHTREMAELAFGKAQFHDGLNSANLDGIDPQVQRNALKALLTKAPLHNTNTVLVTHGQNISAVANASPGEGGALIFRPDGYGGVTLIAHIAGGEWAQLH